MSPTKLTRQWSMNLIKVMQRRIRQCLGSFTMLPVDGLSETWLFRHLSNYIFRACNFGKTKAVRIIFFFKMFKIEFRFQKFSKKLRDIICFWDNCIWIGIVKLPLIRTGYFSSAANVWISSPKIFHVNNRNFFQINWLGSDHWKW